MLEKEVAILKTPNLTFSNSYDSVEKGSTISEKTSKRNSLAKSEELVENVDVLNYGTGNSNGNVKIEENLNFLFTVRDDIITYLTPYFYATLSL